MLLRSMWFSWQQHFFGLPLVFLRREYSASSGMVGPANQLTQVFLNILNNAHQAIDGRGEIVVSTHSDDDNVSIRIRDTGIGIPDELKARIFDPFFTTKPPGQGTGLGLSISYSIVKNLSGTIECQSSAGEGTEFNIILPSRPKRTIVQDPELAGFAAMSSA
jgi:signal transduction histidine kinase